MNSITKNTLESLDNHSNSDGIKYTVEQSRDCRYVVKVQKDNKNVYIGSRYSVSRDVDNFMERLGKINAETIIVVFGVGAAEHLIRLKEDLEERNSVLVVEPDINVLRVLESVPNFDIFQDNRFVLCSVDSPYLNGILTAFLNSISLKNIKVTVFSDYVKIFPEKSKVFFDELNRVFRKSLINNNTSKYFSLQFTKCYLKNISQIIEASSINEFKDVFKGKPAVVVSAGPSLAKNIHELKEVQDKFIIITGARSLNALLNKGITPDFVCLVDPGDVSCRFIKDNSELKVPMIFHEYSNYNALHIYEGEKIFFSSRYVTRSMLNKKIDSLYAGGSVAHTCTALAVYMGCDPVVFIGQDFAYTGEKMHADIAANGQSNTLDDRKKYIMVEGIDGNMVKTDNMLNSYRMNMEEIIYFNEAVTFINSTEGGANMKKTLVMPLDKAINKYALEIIDKNIIENILSKKEDYDTNRENAVNYLNETVEALKEVNKKCSKALDYNDDLYLCCKGIKKGSTRSIIKKLDCIDSFIKEKRNNIGMIDYLLFEIVEKVLTKPEYIISSKDEESEKTEKIHEKSRELYGGIKDKIDLFLPLLESTIEDLQEEKDR